VTADFTGQYQMILTRGRSFEMDILLPLISETDVLGFVSYPIPASVVNMSGDTTFDFNLPAFPGQVTVSGRVTDSGGRGVSDVSVGAFSQSVTGAPNLGFIAGAQTDANGNYSFVVLSGTNYQITFTPPTPAP
jgi:hypothetical protein